MGFFDTVKDRAGALAADAGRASKVTAAQTRLVVLQNDLRKAERAFGQEAFALVERGELEHPELAGALARLRATTAEVHAKEAEIAALRGAAPDEPAGAEAPTAAPPPSVTVADAPEPVVAPAQPVVASPVEEPVEPPLAKKAPARKPAAKPAGKKAPAKKAVPKKPAAGKPAAPKAPAPTAPAAPEKRPRPAKGGAGSSAGATPKKSGRPSTSGPRPAGKNKPAGR